VAKFALVTVVQTLSGSGNWAAPSNLYGATIRCQVWGSASGGGGATSSSGSTGGGAGGAGYGEEPALGVTAGNSYAYAIPAGGAGGSGAIGAQGGNPGDTTFAGDSVTVTAHPGGPGTCSGSNGALGAGAAASGNTIAFGGGNGESGVSSGHGGAGGGGAGSAGAGGAAVSSGGPGGTPDGGTGGARQNTINSAGNPGGSPGGGGGGARGGAVRAGGAGGTGKIILTYTVMVALGGSASAGRSGLRKGDSQGSMGAPFVPVGPPVPAPFDAPQTQQRGARLLRPGRHAQSKGAPVIPPGPVNVTPFRAPQTQQRGRKLLRGGSYRKQGGAPVVPFPAQPVNQWAGTVTHSPSWGDDLPGNASCVIPLTPANSVGTGTGTPTAGNWLFALVGWNAAAGVATINVGCDTHQWWRPAAPSSASGLTRTAIWYQPFIIPPSSVYVAPSAYMDGLSVLVVEVGGLGPWDTVTALASNYAAGATSLPLAAGAPGAAAFMIAAVTGDSTTAGTALTPGGWTPLSTVTAANGVDHSGDAVLAAASITTASAQSISGTASSSENLSGMILSVLQHAPSPVPGGINPNWPYLLFEAAFGSGYGTPADQMTWVNLQSIANGMRLRDWSESTGIQYELSALESSEGTLELDNPDGFLSPANPASPWYPSVVPGTPVRIRAVTPAASRWYVIQRNVERWPQQWDEQLRGVANTVINDQWSVINRELPTPYRAEVVADAPYAWWPADDPAVLAPVKLVNAAPGNSAPLQILTAPGGLSASISVGIAGDGGSITFDFSAVQAFAADSGWMYGDPDSSAWSQTGCGTVSTGRYLQCQDANFPPLSGGITIEAWRNYTWLQTAPPNPNFSHGPQGQPTGEIYIWDITSGGPGGTSLAHLSLDTSGHLRITVGGSSTTVYSGSDLRNATWFGVTVTLTTTKWECWLNGGIAAHASGSVSAGSAWDTFTINGNSNGTAGIGNPEVSHNAVYPVVLPAPRVMAHFTAAYTAFGQMPQPSSLTGQFIPTLSYAPDGNSHTGTFFKPPTTIVGTNSTLAAYVTASGGGSESAVVLPEFWDWCQAVGSGQGSAGDYAWLTASGPAAPQYNWYTGSASGGEQLATTTLANTLFVNSYGSGAAPPAAATPGGDTVGNRLERILQAGGVTSPARCIDAASAAVVAAIDIGGQASGAALGNIVSSDSGLLFMNSAGNLVYFSRPTLAAMPVRWQLGGNIAAGQIPFEFAPGGAGGGDAGLDTDPQQVRNVIQVTQFDVTGAQGTGAASGSAETSGALVFAPDASRYAGVLASQQQNGPCEAKTTSYLQSQASIQSQANWLFDQFGTARQRVTNLTVRAEAASGICPAAWLFVLGANVGDVFTASFTPPGQPSFTGTWRISKITRRRISFADGEASISIIGDVYTTEWS